MDKNYQKLYQKQYYEENKSELLKKYRARYERLKNNPEFMIKKAKQAWIRRQKLANKPYSESDYIYKGVYNGRRGSFCQKKYIAFNHEERFEGTRDEIIKNIPGLTINTFYNHLQLGSQFKGWCFDQVE